MAYAASGRYSSMVSDRDTYLQRARACAKLTIPALMPEEGSTASRKFYTPYQSLGARGVNNLASKLLTALLPPQSSFFRLQMEDSVKDSMDQQPEMKTQMEAGLGKIERIALAALEGTSLRTVMGEVFKQLIVTGNTLLVLNPSGEPRSYRMDKYVVRRAPAGKVLEIVIKEAVAPQNLEPDIQSLLAPDVIKKCMDGTMGNATVDLYTVVCWEEGKYKSWQEINGFPIEGTQESYPEAACPYLALRFSRVDGEHYGRSYVEEYYGDLRSLEGLEKAILLGAGAAAKVIYLVNPNGTTRLKDISAAESGDVKSGNAVDVTTVQTNKGSDFQVAKAQAQTLEGRMSFAFLLNSAIQRSGERVTAEEIRYMARELEDALGGIYSVLSQEFQRPLVTILLGYLQRKKMIPSLPKGSVKPVIVTGVEALGRGQDLARLDEFINGIPATLAQQAAQYLNVGDYLSRRATALALDASSLVKTQDQVDQEQQAAQQAQMGQSVVDKGTTPAVAGLAKGLAGAVGDTSSPPQQ